MSGETALQQAMLEAHNANDVAELAALYQRAGVQREAAGDIDAACFFYTHAYVYALDSGEDGIAAEARGQLKLHGRER